MRNRHGHKHCRTFTCPFCQEEEVEVWGERERGPGMGTSFEVESDHVCEVNPDAGEKLAEMFAEDAMEERSWSR